MLLKVGVFIRARFYLDYDQPPRPLSEDDVESSGPASVAVLNCDLPINAYWFVGVRESR
jgi:hypothetical protein